LTNSHTIFGDAYSTRPGSRFPPGATASPDGVNFCVFSRYATRVELLLFAEARSPEPFQAIELTEERNRTFFFWHVFVEGLRFGAVYAWRVDGPTDTEHTGRRFDSVKDLLDPWARAVVDDHWDRSSAADPKESGHRSLRAVVVEPLGPPREPSAPRGLEGAVIYELHVGGFTRDPASGVRRPGTFAGLIEKIPYLCELGVRHVEMPATPERVWRAIRGMPEPSPAYAANA